MSYRITYQVNVDWIGPGMGPMGGATADSVGMAAAGGAQRKTVFNGTPGGQNSSTFVAADVATLLTGASSVPAGGLALDIYNQLIAAATLAQIQAFSTGGG
jgi:hypothetical protein